MPSLTVLQHNKNKTLKVSTREIEQDGKTLESYKVIKTYTIFDSSKGGDRFKNLMYQLKSHNRFILSNIDPTEENAYLIESTIRSFKPRPDIKIEESTTTNLFNCVAQLEPEMSEWEVSMVNSKRMRKRTYTEYKALSNNYLIFVYLKPSDDKLLWISKSQLVARNHVYVFRCFNLAQRNLLFAELEREFKTMHDILKTRETCDKINAVVERMVMVREPKSLADIFNLSDSM